MEPLQGSSAPSEGFWNQHLLWVSHHLQLEDKILLHSCREVGFICLYQCEHKLPHIWNMSAGAKAGHCSARLELRRHPPLQVA